MQTQSIDTHHEAENIIISLLREKSSAKKFSLIRSLSGLTIQLSKRAIQRVNKGIDDNQVNLIFIDLHYGRELSNKYQKYLSQKRDKT
jgi:hypothetical protein